MSLAAIDFGATMRPARRRVKQLDARGVARYQALVTSRVRVNLGNEGDDRPHWLGVGAVALGGLTCGLLLMLVLGRSLGAGHVAPRAQSASTDRGAVATAPATAPTAVPPDTTVSAIEEISDAPAEAQPASAALAGSDAPAIAANTIDIQNELNEASVAAAAPVLAPVAPAASSASHELVRGHIAYLRCEGVPLQDGPFPCPRDRRLEKQVWSALDRLQQCALPPLGAGGDFELRVEFRTRGRHSFEVKPPRGSEALTSAVQACLANDLELARTQLRPLLMTVLFRFELH
jgi:hypothetical protein